MVDPDAFAPLPDWFVADFTPKDQPAARPISALAYQMTVETARYNATIYYGERDLLTTSADGQTTLLLAGTIYRPQTANLLDLYERRGLDFVADLNGDFCLLLIDRRADVIAFATDRTNSRKLLISWDDGRLTISNSIYLQPARGAAIDRIAVATYLTMSYSYNDRTLYEHVKLLDSASVYRLADGRLNQRKYWQYQFQPPTTATPETLRKELGDLLIEATRIRYRADRSIYVSLSGGYDSSAITGILANVLRAPDVRTFTYAHGQAQPGSDEFVAAQIARLCGYPHEIVPAFDGDVVRVLRRNARIGGGMTRPSDEVDAWIRLGAQAGGAKPILFTGDTLFLEPDWRLTTLKDVTEGARLRDFTVLSWLEPLIGSAVYREFVAATRNEIDAAIKHVPPTKDKRDLREMLRFDQIQSRVTVTWREYYAGRFFQPVHPILDPDILDFLLRLPYSLRRQKQLFIDTVKTMYPPLFVDPRATFASYATYWPAMLRQQNAELQAFVRAQTSPLDNVIDPDILLALLAADRPALTKSNARLGNALKHVYRLLKRANLHSSPLGRPSFYIASVSADHFLKRALTIRAFLAEMETRQSPAPGSHA